MSAEVLPVWKITWTWSRAHDYCCRYSERWNGNRQNIFFSPLPGEKVLAFKGFHSDWSNVSHIYHLLVLSD